MNYDQHGLNSLLKGSFSNNETKIDLSSNDENLNIEKWVVFKKRDLRFKHINFSTLL